MNSHTGLSQDFVDTFDLLNRSINGTLKEIGNRNRLFKKIQITKGDIDSPEFKEAFKKLRYSTKDSTRSCNKSKRS